jgi:adenylate kinase family enzyme
MDRSAIIPLSPSDRRLCVIGTTGSGKSTMAGELSRRLCIPRLEIDSVYWLPGWKERDRQVTRQVLEEFTRAEAWVVDGNYRWLRDIIWPKAEALVWLDYPLSVVMWHLWHRTWQRVLSRELLWGTNQERLVEQFFSKDSLFLWALKTYGRHKKEYSRLPLLPDQAHLKVYRLRTTSEANAWLEAIPAHIPVPG